MNLKPYEKLTSGEKTLVIEFMPLVYKKCRRADHSSGCMHYDIPEEEKIKEFYAKIGKLCEVLKCT